MAKRLEFSTHVQRAALQRAGGICECHRIPHVFEQPCGCPIGPGNTFFEHIIPDGLRKDNSLDNCAVLTKTCWGFKSATYDKPITAKAQRVQDAHYGVEDPWRRRLPGGKDDPYKISMSRRRPVDRRTGEPWRGGRQ